MKKVVYKYPLQIIGMQQIAMPAGAEILSTQMQGDMLCVWALVDTEAQVADRVIIVLGTGHQAHPLLRKTEFIGTVQVEPLVWHVFDCGEVAL